MEQTRQYIDQLQQMLTSVDDGDINLAIEIIRSDKEELTVFDIKNILNGIIFRNVYGCANMFFFLSANGLYDEENTCLMYRHGFDICKWGATPK
jgi:hypothetical protein